MEVRQAALKCLVKVLEHNASYDETIDYYASIADSPSDLINTLAGAIKYKLALDYFIGKISSKGVKKLSPEVRNILRLGVFELEYLQRPEYAVVNSYVNICRKLDKKSAPFVNAVLRNFIRKRPEISIKEDDLSTRYSHPAWLVDKWLTNYGTEKTEKILAFNNKPPKTVLRLNRLKTSKNELVQLLKENNINFKESSNCDDCLILENSGNVRNLPGYSEGLWVVQGESSAMVTPILDPQPDEAILDLCAAPGSKTSHIASLMGDKGEITAVDISSKRLERVKQNCDRLGIKSVKVMEGDAQTINLNIKFDRILVDAPCSNTGVLGKRPDARWNRKPEDIHSLAKLQLEILNNAATMLKSGGVLVYSTCSIEPEENCQVIEKFLEVNSALMLESSKLILQSEYDIDGFFIAKLTKN